MCLLIKKSEYNKYTFKKKSETVRYTGASSQRMNRWCLSGWLNGMRRLLVFSNCDNHVASASVCFLFYNVYFYLFVYLFGCTGSSPQHVGSLATLLKLLVAAVWNLVSWPGIQPRPPALGVRSLSHWTTKEAPTCFEVREFLSLIFVWALPWDWEFVWAVAQR